MGDAYKPKPPYKSVEGMGSKPWLKMTRHGAYVLDRFYAKFNGFNRDNLSLTYAEVKDKMSNRLFTAGLWEVFGFGFIDRVRPGRLERQCSIYRISNRWRKLEHKLKFLDEIERLLKEILKLGRKRASLENRMKINMLRKRIARLSGIKWLKL